MKVHHITNMFLNGLYIKLSIAIIKSNFNQFSLKSGKIFHGFANHWHNPCQCAITNAPVVPDVNVN